MSFPADCNLSVHPMGQPMRSSLPSQLCKPGGGLQAASAHPAHASARLCLRSLQAPAAALCPRSCSQPLPSSGDLGEQQNTHPAA